MKTTKMIAKIAGVVLAGMMTLALASCGSAEDKYLKDLEGRVATLEAAAQAKDNAAYEEAAKVVEDFLALKFDSDSAEYKAYADIKSGKKPLTEAAENARNALSARVDTANTNAPANNESDFEVKPTEDLNGIIITKYKGSRKNVVIPATIQGVPVVSLVGYKNLDDTSGSTANFEIKSITSVVIPSSVKVIGSGIFQGCSELTKVTLPEGLESIGTYAFAKCESLESIDFPSSLKRIMGSAFKASGLKEARLNEGLSYLGSRAFSYCPNLTTIYLPKSLRWISNANSSYDRVVAGDCDALEKIVIPEGFKPRMPTPWEVSSSSKGTKISSLFSGKKINESVALQKELDAYPALQWVWLGSMSPKSAQQEFYNDTGFWF